MKAAIIKGALVGLILGGVLVVLGYTGLSDAWGLSRVVLYLSATPLFSFQALSKLSDPATAALVMTWYAVVGGAFGGLRSLPNNGRVLAILLLLLVIAGHVFTARQIEKNIQIAVQGLVER